MARDMDSSRRGNEGGSGAGLATLLVLLALVFIAGPFFVPGLRGLAQLVCVVFGVVMLIAGGIMIAISQFYVKAASNQAFVRTGAGGPKAIIDGGALVIPQVHKIRWVSLETVKLVVERVGHDALITGDNLRVDIKAEFYIRVLRTAEGVVAAATSLGDRSGDDTAIMDLVGEKLVSAMRTVAARSDLEHLHSKLDEYRDDVKQIVEHDLEPNGLFLETVAISHLNQTPPEHLDPDNNVFDAQGVRKITEITAVQRVERSKAQTTADKQVKELEVTRDQAVYELEVNQASSQAERDAQIKKAKAEREREATEFAAGERQKSEVAEVQAQRAVALAQVEKEQLVEVANQQREAAAQQAGIEKERSVEVKKREAEIAVAEAEKQRAAAQAERIKAETEREKANQAMLTVQKTQEAERSRNITVINKEAEAESRKVSERANADIAAYSRVKEAEAEQEAAEKQALAKIKLAEADKEANVLQADGQRAMQMIPVDVAKENVEVERKKVDVTREDLKNKQEFEKAAIGLQVELAKIEALKAIGIAQAKSIGDALAAADLRIFGDPVMLQAIFRTFTSGQNAGMYVEGLLNSAPAEVKDLAFGTLRDFSAAVSSLAQNLFGKDISPEEIAAAVKAELVKQSTDGADGHATKITVENK